MRNYSIVVPQFWIGSSGRQLRGDALAQVVALYLISNPHANMAGLYYLPLVTMAHEIGSPLKGALKGLQRVVGVGFATYDKASEYVFVHEMARYQIGDSLKPGDNRISSIVKTVGECPSPLLVNKFRERYADVFHLPELPKQETPESPSEAPLEPLLSQEQDQEQDQDQDQKKEEAARSSESFEQFWKAYPKRPSGKGSKPDALRAWKKMTETEQAEAMRTIHLFASCPQWTKDGGEFIPQINTWMNQKRWESPPEVSAQRKPWEGGCDDIGQTPEEISAMEAK